jgi:hypothetical protein
VTFTAGPATTRMNLLWEPYEATATELQCFAQAIERANAGWTAGMDKLERLLEELGG